jgi:FtsP/CotA-like multicopper oxidase with cupredoxin domain
MPNISTVGGVVEVNLEAKRALVNVNGVNANLLTYNGSFPAPTIRAKVGDRLRIHFKNSLPDLGTNILGFSRDMTNLHTHGLHVSPSGNSDNAMLMFMRGESFDFEYDLVKQYPGTLNFYHPHKHGSVAEQYWAGMAGALVIGDETTVLSPYETHLMVIKDLSLVGTDPAPHGAMQDFMRGKEGSIVMVNGQVNPVLNIRPGQVQRWRILNACNARFLKLSFEGHSMNIVGTEGGLIDAPHRVSSFLVSPGERLDVLVRADQKGGRYRLLSLPYSRNGNMGGQQVTLATVNYQGSRTGDAIPASINPAARRISPMVAKTERLALSMGQGRGYINGISFTESSHAMVMSNVGTHEIWEVTNGSGMDHPFHQHVNASQILSITGGDAGYASFLTTKPVWKDVVIVPKFGSVRMLVPVMDYDGMAMFHCHIIEHEDIGMMGMWHMMSGGMGM